MENRLVSDIHIHIGRTNTVNHFLPYDGVERFMKKFDLDQIALMPFELDTEQDNNKIIELSKKNNSIHGLYWIQKSQIKKDLAILKNELHQSIIGVKFHGSFENLPVTDEIYSPIMEFLNNNKSLIVIHCGKFKGGSIESNTSFQHAINLAKKYGNLKVILAHMGGNDNGIMKEAVSKALNISNVYFETSATSTPFRVEYAVDILGPDRVFFGSDYPFCSFRSIFYNVEDSLLDDKIKDKIFHQNFIDLIK